ncbi:hypothetical protein CLAIMM_06112 [Cladophialophora immunda]|nr:hypothetical protein CLAIMM_06112 [Cladophialophora immunda]
MALSSQPLHHDACADKNRATQSPASLFHHITSWNLKLSKNFWPRPAPSSSGRLQHGDWCHWGPCSSDLVRKGVKCVACHRRPLPRTSQDNPGAHCATYTGTPDCQKSSSGIARFVTTASKGKRNFSRCGIEDPTGIVTGCC